MKRALDLLASVILLIVLSPLMLLISVLVCMMMGRPIIFKQERPGLNSKKFTMYKFRTLSDVRNNDGILLPDDQRITSFGKFLRATSMDELPELLNVLKGEMSLVGPRPLLVEYLKLYTSVQARRHEVRPGITGWAQINGRNRLGWDERFKMDVWYVDHRSIYLDVKILFWTILRVFMGSGVSAHGCATMSKFEGKKV